MAIRPRRFSTALAMLLGGGFMMTVGDVGVTHGPALVSSVDAQPLRKLIARLRGQTLPDGIVKAEGRIEARQVDVSSKYSGQLAEISVDEGTKVTVGQVIARVSSPEFEAQLRAAQSDLQSARDALAVAEADIASRQAALEFAKADFERGQELLKTGSITAQTVDQRKRNSDAALAAVQNMTAQRNEAQKSIEVAKAKLQQIQAMIDDLTLVAPRNGEVQYKLKRAGETVAAGEPIVTVLDFTDIYMIVFLHAADAGRLVMEDEARLILDAVPEYVIPARVSFVAQEYQFTPKTVETADERKKEMFLVKLKIDPQDLKRYYGRLEGGLRGAGFVLTSRDAKWPAELQVKLPPAPAVPPVAEAPASAAAPPSAAAPVAQTPAPVADSATPESAPASATQTSAPVIPVAIPPTPPRIVETPAPEAAPAPVVETTTPAPKPVSRAAPPDQEPDTQTATPPRKAPTTRVMQEPVPEFAPENLGQLIGAWAYSRADCDKLFQRRGKAIAYRQPIDQFAQAAIVESQRIRLPSATCQINRASNDGGALKVSGDCQDSISYSTRTVYIRLRSGNEVAYSPTGDPVTATTLIRCLPK